MSKIALCKLIIVVATILAPGPVMALSVQVCGKWATSYTDVPSCGQAGGGDDYYTDNCSKTAVYGGYAIYDQSWHWVVGGYFDSNGCRTVTVTSGAQYYVVLFGEMMEGTNLISVRSNQAGWPEKTWTTSTSWTSGGTYYYYTTIGPESNVLAAAAWALVATDLGESNITHIIYCGPHSQGPTDITIDTPNYNKKYVIAHEMGHVVFTGAHYNASDDCTYVDAQEICLNDTSHYLPSREFMSCVGKEGWADLYSAYAWNDEFGADCYFHSWIYMDYNNDGTSEWAPWIECKAPQYNRDQWELSYCGYPTTRTIDDGSLGSPPTPTDGKYVQIGNWSGCLYTYYFKNSPNPANPFEVPISGPSWQNLSDHFNQTNSCLSAWADLSLSGVFRLRGTTSAGSNRLVNTAISLRLSTNVTGARVTAATGDSSHAHFGTEYDWMVGWWNFISEGGWSPDDAAQIIADISYGSAWKWHEWDLFDGWDISAGNFSQAAQVDFETYMDLAGVHD